ncbi:hypothetical protein [Ruminococcus sp. FC2018]|uniref:hypothetical protein n=1 Tax=Ruminococcus sp. FC2018 TaxID=1410617 RepID=UPI00048D6677|nr:hypothetical protein [Ruminococcus sp. FC2018]
MGLFSDKSCRVDLAYCRDINYVYNAVGYAAQMCGFKIESADSRNYTINLRKSISLFTWGERVYIAMGVIPDGRTGVTIVSQPNLGTEIGARKQNQKNVEMLVNMINQYM